MILNDCSHYHAGSAAVMQQLRRFAGPLADDPSIVLLNGEGTMHHSAPRAMALLDQADKLKAEGKTVHLLNSVWQSMPSERLAVFSSIAMRESLSAAEAGGVPVLPDLALLQPVPRLESRAAKRSGLLVIDSVSKKETDRLEVLAAACGGELLRMCDYRGTIADLMLRIASASAVVTGRFHGAVFCLSTGTPFLATPSNTWKTVGMLTDCGIPEAYMSAGAELTAAVKAGAFKKGEVDIPEMQRRWADFFAKTSPVTRAERPGCPVAPEASVVLVGNGPSVLTQRLGRVIDGFDEVIRFNSYSLAGLAEQVGTRTTLWSTFGRGTLPRDSAPPSRAIFIHPSGTPAVGTEHWRVPPPYYRALQNELRALSTRPPEGVVRPSSGCLVTGWLLHCGVRKVHTVGMDHFKKEHSRQHHYWDARTFGRPVEHDGDAEAAMFEKWMAEGRVARL
jgi:hypothetical protein